jgi:hypothetical protein
MNTTTQTSTQQDLNLESSGEDWRPVYRELQSAVPTTRRIGRTLDLLREYAL